MGDVSKLPFDGFKRKNNKLSFDEKFTKTHGEDSIIQRTHN